VIPLQGKTAKAVVVATMVALLLSTLLKVKPVFMTSSGIRFCYMKKA
jgi:hypothetical protein